MMIAAKRPPIMVHYFAVFYEKRFLSLNQHLLPYIMIADLLLVFCVLLPENFN